MNFHHDSQNITIVTIVASKEVTRSKCERSQKKIIIIYISPTIQSRKKISQVLLYFYILNSIKQANLLIKVPDILFYFTFYIILSRNIVLILHKRSGGHYLTSIR